MEETQREIDETVPLQTSPVEKKTTCLEKLKSFGNNITVEPAAFLMLLSSMLAAISTQTLMLDKTCRVNLNLSDAICDSIRAQDSDNNTVYEQQVQRYLAVHLIWKSALQSALPCVLFPFVGSWMDKTGRRKVIMLLPITGEILQSISNILNVIFFYQLPVEVLIFLDTFFGNFLGGWSIMFLAVFSYIADITTEENRTHRLGWVSFCTYVGMPIGLALSGVILRSLGYFAIYGSAMTLHVINFCYILLRLRDPPRTPDQLKHDGRGICYTLKSFFDPSHMKSTVQVLCKKTPDNRRRKLCILLLVVCILFGPMYGEVSVLYLSTRYRFNWDEVKFSIFQTYNFVLHTVGTVFSIMIFSKYLKWHDSVLGIISSVSKFSSAFIYCFAPNGSIFYIAPLVDMFGGIALLALRSIFSKSVAPDELGKVNSIVGLFENLMPLVYVPLYTKVYTATMDVLPGAVFLLGAGMIIPAISVFIWLFIVHRRSLKMTKSEEHAMPYENNVY